MELVIKICIITEIQIILLNLLVRQECGRDIQEIYLFLLGACQSFYEAIIQAGANFASSPARILIDFVDPLIVAENIAYADTNRFVSIRDFENELRDGQKGISGVGSKGKRK